MSNRHGRGKYIQEGDPATETQLEILKLIIALQMLNGHQPSLRELAKRQGVTIGTIQNHLRSLQQKGWLTWQRGEPRTFKIPGIPKCKCCKGTGLDAAAVEYYFTGRQG